MHKKDALIVSHRTLNAMVKHDYESNDLSAYNVSKLLSGKHVITGFIADNIGSNCGSLKAITFANYVTCQDTASQLLGVSKTIGSGNRLQRNKIIKMLNTLFTMQHTSTKMVALLIL